MRRDINKTIFNLKIPKNKINSKRSVISSTIDILSSDLCNKLDNEVIDQNFDTTAKVTEENVQHSVMESCISRTEVTMDIIIIQTTNANGMINHG